MKPFFLTVAILLACSAGLIFWADTTHRWHRRLSLPPRALAPGEAWLIPDTVDGREIHAAMLPRIAPPRVLLLGSSRIAMVSQNFFGPKTPIYNTHVGGASVEDLVAFWQIIKSTGKTPTYVLIFLDPWMLNKNYIPVKAIINLKHIESFVPQRQLRILQVKTWLANPKEMVSMSALNAALDYVKEGWQKQRQNRQEIMPEAEVPVGQSYVRWDGLILNNGQLPATLPGEIRKRIYAWFNRAESCAPLAQWEFGRDNEQLLARLLSDMLSHQTQLLVVLPPFNPVARGLMEQKELWPLAAQMFDEYAASAQALKRIGRGVVVCDALRSETFQCGETDFLDGYHMQEPCARRVMRACVSNAPAWQKAGLLEPSLH